MNADYERHHGHVADTPECWDKCGDPDTDPTRHADCVVEPNGYDEWVEGTRVIRQWVRGDTISTEALVAELRYWADYFEVRQEQERHHA